jgi:hypothetical protein
MNELHYDQTDRRKKSYISERTRKPSVKVDRRASVTDSLTQFLAHAHDEDLIFHACASPKKAAKPTQSLSSSTTHATPRQYKTGGGGFSNLPHISDHVSRSMEVPGSPLDSPGDYFVGNDQTERMPFARTTSRRIDSSKGKRPNNKKSSSKQSKATGIEQEEPDSDDDLESFAVVVDDDDDVSISSAESLSHRTSSRNGVVPAAAESSSRSARNPHPIGRAKSFHGKYGNTAQVSTSTSNAASGTPQSRGLRRTQSDSRGHAAGRRHEGSSPKGLADLERHSRRQRMKQAYRGQPSRGVRRLSLQGTMNGSHIDEADGGDSVTSGTSMYSTTSTSRGHRRSGLEGGALNAFLGDERVARDASKGLGVHKSSGSVTHEEPSEDYLRERKSRQESIMDVAIKEKWQYQARASKDAELQERSAFVGSDNDYSSDEDGLRYKNEKGLIGNLKKAVRKTAKTSKSAAKGTVNVVKDPKRAARKVGGFAKEVGKETAKMVMDPTLAAKRGKNGIKGTMNLTTKVTGTVAKGGIGLTTSLAKNSLNVTTKVVGTTIDGAGKIVHGAVGFLHHEKDDAGIEYAEYDPRALISRQKTSSLINRFAPGEDHENEDNDDNNVDDVADSSLQRRDDGFRKGTGARTPVMSSTLVPTIDTGRRSSSWDL